MASNVRKVRKVNGWAITSLILGVALVGLVLAAVIYKSKGFTDWNIPGWFGIQTQTSEEEGDKTAALNMPLLHYEDR